MKTAMIIGGASKNSIVLLETLLEKKYKIINVGSSAYENPLVENIKIDWKDLNYRFVNKNLRPNCTIDFVFFNQNSSSLCEDNFFVSGEDILDHWKLMKDWQNSLWLSCQLPYLLIHTLGKKLASDAKVGWMLSSYIDYNKQAVHCHPDYSSYKFFNYMAMKCFSEQNDFSTFGIVPDFNKDDKEKRFKNIINEILDTDRLKAAVYKF